MHNVARKHEYHVHGPGCGHKKIKHEDHFDYLHDGRLHSSHEDHYDEHQIQISDGNPDVCAPMNCQGDHESNGDEKIPHGDHFDYLYNGRLHHVHGDHCDDHGAIDVDDNL